MTCLLCLIDFALPVVGPEHGRLIGFAQNMQNIDVFSARSNDRILRHLVIIAGAVVRNLEACQVLVTALLYPDISNMTLLPAGNKDQDAPPSQFSLTVFSTLLSIIRDHPMNYFLLERLNILSYAIERLDSYHPDLQVSYGHPFKVGRLAIFLKAMSANGNLTIGYN